MSPPPSNGHCPPARVRVALVGCIGLLGDIICKTVDEDPDIDVVARVDTGPVATSLDADLVLWHNAEEAAVAWWLSTAQPMPQILATLDDGRDASLWQLAPHRTELGALSPALLIETILDAAARQSMESNQWPKN